ncbi:MAG: hypothetical protein ACRD5W_00300 [Candidatus Acidiferrales bacterium]
MAQIKSIELGSAFKLFAVLYGMFGLLIGAFISLLSVLGFMGGAASGTEGAAAFLFGTSAIVIMPILYGCIGAIGGVIGCLIYNIAAKIAGGLEVDLQ